MVELYDTTLRDGSQAEGVNFSLADKLRIARKLDELGIHYIEGGWPGSNLKDAAFFQEAPALHLRRAKLAAFGCTRRPDRAPEDEPLLQTLLHSGTPVCTIFGKSWALHVTEVLRTTPEENLRMIRDSVAYLKAHGREVIYDAEHFFDGYKQDPGYALATLQAAQEGGADRVVLCDTNGGSLPWEVGDITARVRSLVRLPLGIHTHNDCELAVANAIAAIQAGATHVQGTINGVGERTGNASLISIIAILNLKMGLECLRDEDLERLTEFSAFFDEVANLPPNERQPFVGRCAFAHKAGMHVDAIAKNPHTFEQIDPRRVGNTRRILVSELSGSSTVTLKGKEFGLDLSRRSPETRGILDRIMRLEHEGYVFEGAEASLELLMKRATGHYRKLFDLIGFRVIVEKRGHDEEPITEATLKIAVDGQQMLTVAEGDGPVHALDGAMRKALEHFYPELQNVRLTDFKVRVVDAKEGTAAKVRVLVESADDRRSWSTIGVSTNIIEASWQALADSVEYALSRPG
ncbi:MAG: citramalate synthase, partial [Armatimonadetes bacterium]|nr:citramalate synthase [Armatimonadota bacterium]